MNYRVIVARTRTLDDGTEKVIAIERSALIIPTTHDDSSVEGEIVYQAKKCLRRLFVVGRKDDR